MKMPKKYRPTGGQHEPLRLLRYYHTLHVHVLTRIVGSARRNSYTWSVVYRWSDVGRLTPVLLLSGGEHPSAYGGERFASARQSCCITHTRTQLLGRTAMRCGAWWRRTLPATLHL